MSLDTYRSPSDAFAATAARRPDGPFLLAPASAGLSYAPEGFRIEYGAFKTEVDRLRVEYAAAGYGRGARVARAVSWPQCPSMAFTSRYSSNPKTPNSRPLPDCL